MARTLHYTLDMAARLIRRRRDGLMEIRRARARDLVLSSDSMVLLFLLAGWALFTLTLVMSLVFHPAFLMLAVWAVFAVAIDQRRAATPRLAAAHTSPPIGPAA